MIELIGVREEVALQAARVAGLGPLEEGVVVDIVRRGVHEVLDGADSLGLELFKDLLHSIAFGEGYRRRDHGDRRRLHPEPKAELYVQLAQRIGVITKIIQALFLVAEGDICPQRGKHGDARFVADARTCTAYNHYSDNKGY